MLRFVRGLAPVVALALILPIGAMAAAEQPQPADLIFNARHLDLVGKGGGIAYKFEHSVTDEKLMGKAFTDDVKIAVANVTPEGQRVLDVTVFTGDRQRPVQNFDGLSINPVFIWFLDKSVENYRVMSGGNHNYIKGRMRDAFVDKAKLEPIKVDFGGKSIDGYKITIVPFVEDPNKHKMQGFENSKFTFVLSKDIPGYFYELNAEIFSSQAGTGKMTDRLVLVEAK
jgi:hypothetical protein